MIMAIKEENLIQYSGNLMPGQRLVKVGNTFIPVGVGGAFEPSGSGTCKYYKCASVDTANMTWSGYELILTDGAYSVSDVVTEGLSYSAVTPVVGNTYSEDVLILASPYMGWKAPADGLVFYADLKDVNNTTARTGETLTFSNATNSTQNGIPCIFFDSGYMHCPGTSAPTGSAPRTVSLWVKQYNPINGYPIGGYGAPDSSSQNKFFACRLYSNKIGIWGDDADWDSSYTLSQTIWHHYLWLNDGSTDKIYIDGVLAVQKGYTRSTRNDYIFIGRHGYNASTTQYATAFRIYNRTLTQDEITTLAKEFTPTTA